MRTQPNILFLLSDEHSFRFANYMTTREGGERVVTPTLDRLAARATIFKAAYCAVPLCVPSRMSLMTGLEAQFCGAFNDRSILDPSLDTLPKALARAGYDTALVGKMHFNGRNQFHGFQHRPYGDLVGKAMHQWEEIAWLTPQERAAFYKQHQAIDELAGRTANAGETRIPESLICDRIVAEESIAYLRNRPSKRPWFLCASFSRPHFPMTAPSRFLRLYDGAVSDPFVPPAGASFDHPVSRSIRDGFKVDRIDRDEMLRARKGYLACISYLDEIIGDMLLRMEASGLLDEAIIVYSSDHGEMAGELGTWWKSGWYEGCTRVPLFISTPEQRRDEQPNRTIETPVSLCDLAPTLAAMGGGKMDSVSGRDLSASIEDGAEAPDRPVFCDHINARWGAGTEYRSARWREWKYVTFRSFPSLLFNLEKDPFESVNLIDQAAPGVLEAFESHRLDFALIDGAQTAHQRALREKYALDENAGTPSQYLLPEGKLVGADVTLYHSVVLTDDPASYFADWPGVPASDRHH